MSALKHAIQLETAFNNYTLTQIVGEGGAGRVYAGQDESGLNVAVKILLHQDTDKRRRFKNEIGFLSRNQHPNLVSVVDHGMSSHASAKGPFYVMRRYDGSLRDWINRGIAPPDVLPAFSQVLDGVEAAHLLGATHRDIKPENVLSLNREKQLAVADFGVANFTEDFLITPVKTPPGKRLANFQYAAPEQRAHGGIVGVAADIYALGLILNELFTGSAPHGSGYTSIASVAPPFAFLDPVVDVMIRQRTDERPKSIAEVKGLIQRHQSDAVTMQKLDALKQVVVPVGTVTDPLAFEPPTIISAEWDDGALTITLDRPVSEKWVHALRNMGSFSEVMGYPPTAFMFNGAVAKVAVPHRAAQNIIDTFKPWLVRATQVLKYNLENEAALAEERARENLRRQTEAEEIKRRTNQSLRF